jgi:hypothetical protein
VGGPDRRVLRAAGLDLEQIRPVAFPYGVIEAVRG